MNAPTVGSLFSGYAGAELALQMLWPNLKTRWVSDVCKFDKNGNAGHFEPHRGPCRVLAHHFPGVPNLGDITKIDWSRVEPVDIITGGSPCQDLSHAGKRAGMKPGTRSGLWASMCDAIDILRPSLVIWENVRGALSTTATVGDVEQCEFCMDATGGGTMRALGRVLGDLAEIGYDAIWTSLQAADVGACHGRFRVFVVAWPANAESVRWKWDGFTRGRWPGSENSGRAALVPTPQAHDARGPKTAEQVAAMRAGGAGVKNLNEFVLNDLLPTPVTEPNTGNGHAGYLGGEVKSLPTPSVADADGGHKSRSGARGGEMLLNGLVSLFPTPRASDADHAGPNSVPASLTRSSPPPLHGLSPEPPLLPTPVTNDMGAGKEPDAWDAWTDDMRTRHGNGNGHGRSLEIEAKRLPLLPSPQTSDTNGAGDKPGEWADRWQLRDITLGKVRAVWGDYAPAIIRAEHAVGRPAPSPTLPTGRDGKAQLSTRFEEWMMMLPDGWVTNPAIWDGVKPSTARNDQVRLLGNGIVPAQMAEAVRWCLGVREATIGKVSK